MKKILMIAYHYPPVGVSSGVHRTLKFSQFLLNDDWLPIVLTVQEKAYQRVNNYQLKDVPDQVHVERAFALDTSRHLSIKGRYFKLMALPDQWVSWFIGGVLSGLKLIRRLKPQVIYSTYPIATAHLIGLVLHRLSGLPWVADFRDSMTEPDYPSDKMQWKVYRWIERQVVRHAKRVIFTTPSAMRMYVERYPHISSEKWVVIENGFDEEDFIHAERAVSGMNKQTPNFLKLTHSGVLYPSERDPTVFFSAISALKIAGVISAETLNITLRATGHDALYAPLLAEKGIDDIVKLAPSVSYGDALKEMLESDGLLIFQAASCNHQIPAKLYEYIRAKRPILALTDIDGDTASVLNASKIGVIAPLDAKAQIMKGLGQFLESIKSGTAAVASENEIKRYSRKSRTRELAQMLDSIIE